MREFDVFVKTHKELDQKTFLSRFTKPFLLILVDVGVTNDTKGFRTEMMSSPLESNNDDRFVWIAPLAPRDGVTRAFDMVTIGRTDTNDITIPLAEISKMHGYFNRPTGGGYAFVDAGSTNGSKIDGQEITPKEPYPLSGGEEIVLAERVSVIFLLPEDLYRRIQITPVF